MSNNAGFSILSLIPLLATSGGSSGDNIVQGYYYNEQFYEEAAHTTLITPDVKNLYIDITTATSYQAYSYNGTNYILCGSDLTNYYNKTETPIQTSVDKNSTNNQLVGAKCFYDNSLTFEHYNIADVLDLSISNFRVSDTTKYEAQCILKKDKSEGILFLNFYADSSTSQSSTGWKRITALNSTFPYKVKQISTTGLKEAARNLGSIWDGSGYANLAISIYSNGDIQSYYYSNILNKNGGLNICLCFPITKK